MSTDNSINALDRLIAVVAPQYALQRVKARRLLNFAGAGVTRTNKGRRQKGGINTTVRKSAADLRQQARALEMDYDLVKGLLDTIVKFTVGPNGITVQPQPRRADGTMDSAFNNTIRELWQDWSKAPEVTRQYDRAAMERQIALNWARDGEIFMQRIKGTMATLDHGTTVPYSLELLPSEMIPLTLTSDNPAVVRQGIRINAWNRATGIHVYRKNPDDSLITANDTKVLSADRFLHLKHTRYVNQLRGVTMLAPVMTRLQDIKDYEDSERTAARIAAAMAFFIKRGQPDMFDADDYVPEDDDNRIFPIERGIMFDTLQPGEDVGSIQSNRPSSLLTDFLKTMHRAIAAGTGTSYSSITRDYDGTYSSRRQELVESFIGYGTMTAEIVNASTKHYYRDFLDMAILSGSLSVPGDINRATLYDAEYHGPIIPWIDPEAEINALILQLQAKITSRAQIVRDRGGNFEGITAEQIAEEQVKADTGIIGSGDIEWHVKTIPIPDSEPGVSNKTTRAQKLDRTAA